MGVRPIWNLDHFFPLYGDRDGPHFEGWTTLATLGAETRRAPAGCLVLRMSYRNQALLSAMTTTLQHMTGGLLIPGLGTGWALRDHDEYGYEVGTLGQRLRNLERGLEIIKARWEQGEPRPLRGTVPILLAGAGRRSP